MGALAEVKLLVARAVRPGGAVVLNANDALLRERAAGVPAPVLWFALDPELPETAELVAASDRAAIHEDGRLVLVERGARTPVM
jgi:cyanophycin synthetase